MPDPFAEEARADFIYDICKPRTKLHTMMYAMADKYDLTDLKSQARQRFLINFYDKDEYEGHCCQDQDLQDVVIPVPETWAEVTVITKLVYSTTPSSDRGLRDIVLEFMTRYFHVSNCPSAFEAIELMHLITNTHGMFVCLLMPLQAGLGQKYVKVGYLLFMFHVSQQDSGLYRPLNILALPETTQLLTMV